MHGKPVFPAGLHRGVRTMIFLEPSGEVAQTTRKGRETLAFVAGNAMTVRARDARNHEIAVYIHTAADRISDRESAHCALPYRIELRNGH